MTASSEQKLFTQALTLAAVLLLACGSAQAQREFREYPSFEGADADAPLPPDYQIPAELVIGRLMYPSAGRGFFGGANYKRGATGWTDDRAATAPSCRCCAASRAPRCAAWISPWTSKTPATWTAVRRAGAA